jgi:hypothetical protein
MVVTSRRAFVDRPVEKAAVETTVLGVVSMTKMMIMLMKTTSLKMMTLKKWKNFWEEVEDEDYDDEIMDEDYEEKMGQVGDDTRQQQLQSSFSSLVDRPAQMGKRRNSLDSLNEEDSNFAVSSVEPSRHGAPEESSHIISQSQHSQDGTVEGMNDDIEMGSYDSDGSLDSDSNEEPDDYEGACRELIAIVHPNSDPDDMIRRCDLKVLYRNLRQQYQYLIQNIPALAYYKSENDESESGELWNSAGDMGQHQHSDFVETEDPISTIRVIDGETQSKRTCSDWERDDHDPLKSTDIVWGSIKGEAIDGADVNVDAVNQFPASFDKAFKDVAQVLDDEERHTKENDDDRSPKVE